MNKIYPIISLNSELYMIDKEAIIKKDDWYMDIDMNYSQCVDEDFIAILKEKQDLNKIIASSNKTLGLPLLPSVEENIFDRELEVHRDLLKNADYNEQQRLLIQCDTISYLKQLHKAPFKKYTEEDMINAMGIMAYEMHINGMQTCSVFYHKAKTIWEENKHLFSKIPTSVEVEMKQILRVKSNLDTWNEHEYHYILPVDENNFVKIIKWI